MKKERTNPTVKCCLWVLLPLLFCMLLHSLALTPCYLSLVNDIEWRDTIWTTMLGYVQLVLEYAFYWLLFAYLALGMGKWKLRFYLPVLLLALPMRFGLEMLMKYVTMGFPTLTGFFSDFSLQLLFGAIHFAVAALIVRFVVSKRRAFFLSLIPTVLQLAMVGIVIYHMSPLFLYEIPNVILDIAVNILCLFAGYGVIALLEKRFGKEPGRE